MAMKIESFRTTPTQSPRTSCSKRRDVSVRYSPPVDNLKPGDIVKWVKPEDAADAALRFVVLEAHYDVDQPRAQIRVLAECMPNWNPNLLPVSLVAIKDIEVA